MKIRRLREFPAYSTYTDTLRETHLFQFKDVILTGRNLHYPNCLLWAPNNLINPYDERVMSLQKDSFYENDTFMPNEERLEKIKEQIREPVYFFTYNVDNYYHFVYDSLPCLFGYFTLRVSYPNMPLLLQTSHPSKTTLPPFVKEFFKLLGIKRVVYGSPTVLYKTVYVATSVTHGGRSGDPPSSWAHRVWNGILTQIPEKLPVRVPPRIYISRRSWIHGKTDNLGTNYTTRRRCMNEDALVEMFTRHGFQEWFAELLTTEQKLYLFQNTQVVAGLIGGGMCNLLFSPPKVRSLILVTPCFLEVNQRFRHSMDHTHTLYSDSCALAETGRIPSYTRVKVKQGEHTGCIGEVEGYEEVEGTKRYTVALSQNDIAGFSQDFPLRHETFLEEDLEPLDGGLNSPFVCDVDAVERDLKLLLEAPERECVSSSRYPVLENDFKMQDI